jgi:hypothetical protein
MQHENIFIGLGAHSIDRSDELPSMPLLDTEISMITLSYGWRVKGIINSKHKIVICNEIEHIPRDVPFNLHDLTRYYNSASHFTKEFYDNPTFSDVILEIEGKEIKAHKVILSILSEKFKIMFCCGLFESNKKKIIIKEHKLAYFEYILKYMYSTEIENDSLNPNWAFDDYIKILKLSDEYFIIDIKEFAQQKIISLVTLENFSKVAFSNSFRVNIFIKSIEICWCYIT